MDKVIVSSSETIVVETDTTLGVVTGTLVSGGSGSGMLRISDMDDLDMTEAVSGAVLVYDATTAVWKATDLLQQQRIDCGQF